MVKVSFEDQQRLIDILKYHTAQTNSVSPSRHRQSPIKKIMTPNRDTNPCTIRSTIDANKFFNKRKEPEMEDFSAIKKEKFFTPKIELKNELDEVNRKAKAIEIVPGDERNKQLLEFIKTVKDKFSKMEDELESTKSELSYYKRKSDEQSEVIDELRKKERYANE
jgi:vacuolar-type H+-ATPase subunit I/STV1